MSSISQIEPDVSECYQYLVCSANVARIAAKYEICSPHAVNSISKQDREEFVRYLLESSLRNLDDEFGATVLRHAISELFYQWILSGRMPEVRLAARADARDPCTTAGVAA